VLPSVVLTAARALGVDEHDLRPLPGAAGQTWAAGEHILRVRPAGPLAIEMAAYAAAARVLATPEVLDIVHLPVTSAALLTRLPGRPVGDLDGVAPEQARRRGLACGHVHAQLAAVAAPREVPSLPGPTPPGPTAWRQTPPPPAGDRLLHLDLHPFNVLVDEDEKVSGVVDWANAATGHPDIDRARTATVLTLDPAALARQADPSWAALVEGWSEAGELTEVPAGAMAWACRFMLNDLAGRYNSGQLAGVYRALQRLAE
jgi:aminoglycoside phosphotransferase (APT) family kinase protein